jgi:hypothetical protein
MTRLHRLTAAVSLVAAAAAFVPPPAAPLARPTRAAVTTVTIYDVASQLGLTIAPMYEGVSFELGTQFTGTLRDPVKLGAFGISGMHVGARVVAAFITPTMVYVEADEMSPVVQKASVKLHIGADGLLRQ